MPGSVRLAAAASLRRLRRLHRRFAFPVLDTLWPSRCFACRRPLGPLQRMGACAGCWADLRPLRGPLCTGCGLPRPGVSDLTGPARGRCAACVLRPRATDRVQAVLPYDRRARRFLLRAKLGGRVELLEALGEQLASSLAVTGLAGGCALLVPVPSHPWSVLRRGFSPARELARPVGRRLDLAVAARVLGRRAVRGTSAKRLAPGARRRLAGAAYRLRCDVAGLRLLLIDDVMTTGATLEACARLLKRAGAAEVRAAVWARTLPAAEV